jgi:hypothetical protein
MRPLWSIKRCSGIRIYLGVMHVINGCREILRQLDALSIPISFWFDEHPGSSEHVLQGWKIAKSFGGKDITSIMGTIGFGDDKQCVPLQCADLLAWHIRRDYIKPAEDHGRCRPEYDRLRRSVSRYTKSIENEDGLRLERERLWSGIMEQFIANGGQLH